METVKVDGSGVAHGVEEALPADVHAAFFQALNGQASGQVALQGDKPRHRVGVIGRQRGPIFGNERAVLVIGQRHHLGYVHAFAGVAQRIGQGVAAHEGHGHEFGFRPQLLAQQLNGLRRRSVGANHNDGLRVGVGEPGRRHLHRAGVALVVPGPYQIHIAAAVQRPAGAFQPIPTIGVVLIKHGYASDALAGEVGHHLLGFLVVGRAHVEHVVQLGVAQELCARERPDEGRARLVGHRRRGPGGRRAHRANQPEYPISFEQPQGLGKGEVRFVAVIQRLQHQFAAMHAASVVRLFERRLDAQLHPQAQRCQRAG